jgi:CO dehydrogenase maturation factor
MTTTIALAGKGGVGKTTISVLLIKYLIKAHHGPILAVDADPSSNLNLALGVDLPWTVGDIREGILDQVKTSLLAGGAAMGALPGGNTKREYLEYQIRSSMVEGDRFDLIAMGRSEGQGCYCAVNHNLREVIDTLTRNYPYVVIDNEAGLEHLSRRTTRDVQHLIIVSDPTLRGIKAAERIIELKNELDISIEKTHLIINRVNGSLPQVLSDEIARSKLPILGTLPEDRELEALELQGKPVVDLNSEAVSFCALEQLLSQLI